MSASQQSGQNKYDGIERYDFVMLPKRVRKDPRPQARFDIRIPNTLTGSLTLTFVCEQPIHVGAGVKRMMGTHVVRAASRVGGALVVPGSSLKGSIRSRYEAITCSCLMRPRQGDKIRSSSGIQFAEFRRDVLDASNFDRCSIRGYDPARTPLCSACALFGAPDLRGRVTFNDLRPVSPIESEVAAMPEQFAPNLHHLGKTELKSKGGWGGKGRDGGGDQYFEVVSLRGRKFAITPVTPVRSPNQPQPVTQRIEVIPKGTRLTGRLSLINVTHEELGGLLAALGVEPLSRIKVGAGKGLGFGRLRVVQLICSLREPSGRSFALDQATLLNRFMASPDCFKSGLERLVGIHRGEI